MVNEKPRQLRAGLRIDGYTIARSKTGTGFRLSLSVRLVASKPGLLGEASLRRLSPVESCSMHPPARFATW